MALAPSNIRAVKDDIDGTYVKIAWDDANTNTAATRLWDAGGTVEQSYTRAGLTAMLRAGSYKLSIKTSDGQESAKVAFTVTAQPAPSPPAPLTARQHLEAAVGPLEDNSQVAVYPAPSAVLTVKADGTLTPA